MTNYATEEIEEVSIDTEEIIRQIWIDTHLEGIISFDLFRMAMVGYYSIDFKKKDKLIIIDYSKLSAEKRFYVIDLERNILLYQCYVAHGKNTGGDTATNFSNQPRTQKSCLGFLVTAETYNGKHGYSLRLDGLEKGINDNARKRSIVIHAADYVSQSFINKNGRLGRSWGCPALPKELTKEIIDSISGGRCIFIFGNDKEYFKESEYIERDYADDDY